MRGTVTHVGAATIALTVGGLNIVTDPALDPAGSTFAIPIPTLGRSLRMRRTIDPALTAADLPATDLVLLSHDHPDHLDRAGRVVLDAASVTLTTPAAASRLGPQAVGLTPWDSYELARGGTWVRITATPARHGPAGVQQEVGEVIGFVIATPGTDSVLYISGDTVYYEDLDEIGRRYQVGTAFLFFGDAHFPETGTMGFTMNARQGANLAAALNPRRVIPVHYDAFAHLAEPPEAIGEAFRESGLADRLQWLSPGVPEPLDWPDAHSRPDRAALISASSYAPDYFTAPHHPDRRP
jgi:L-ascorbate metabolism protein UlaG (beta-lactamase superfamily)